jgi:hypothetical protein
MTQSPVILALTAAVCVTAAFAETASPPRNDLPQPPERHVKK